MVTLTARYILRKNIIQADQLSCPDHVLSSEWFLLPQVFNAICKVYGHSHRGLFAARASKKLPLYVPSVPDMLRSKMHFNILE